MLFIYLYHDDLYSNLWKSDLYFSPRRTGKLVVPGDDYNIQERMSILS